MANKLFNSIIPPVPKTADRQTLQFLAAIKNALTEISKSAKFTDEGFVARSGTGATASVEAIATSVASGENDLSYRTPAAPTNLQATGIFESIVLEWDYAGPEVGNFEIWRSTSPQIGQAVLRGVSSMNIFQDSVAPGSTHYYWVRGVSTGQVEGPFNSTNGTAGTTGIKISQNDLYQSFVDNFGALAGTDILAGDLSAEILARTNADSTLTASVAEATSNVTSVRSDLDSEIATRISEIQSLSGNITAAQTDITTNATDIAAEVSARIAELQSLSGTVADVQTDVTTNATDIAAETATRTSQIASLNDSVAAVQTDVTANATDIAAETSTRTSQIATLNNSVTSIQTDVTTNATDIAAETATRTSQIASLNDSVAAIQTDVTTNTTDIAAETATRTSQIASLNDSVAAIQTDVTTNTTDIAAETAARTAQIAATDAAVASLTTSVATNASDLAAEVSARTTQVAAQNQSIATLDQEITTVASDLASEVSTLETAIANIGTDTAAVTEIVNARVDPLEDAVEASYVLRTNANNTVAGFSLFNSTAEPSTFDIVADRFSVSPSYTSFPVSFTSTVEMLHIDGSDGTGRNLLVADRFFGDDLQLYVTFTSVEFVHGLSVGFVGTIPSGSTVANATISVDFRSNNYSGNTIDHDVTDEPVTQIANYSPDGQAHNAQPVYGVHIPVATARNISHLGVGLTFSGSNVTPFTVDGTTGTVFMNAAMIKDATITNAMIEDVAAEKITTTELSSFTANLGAVTAGTLTGPNGRFQIDLTNNRLDVYDENGTLRVRIGDLS